MWKEWQSHSDGPILLTSWLQEFTVIVSKMYSSAQHPVFALMLRGKGDFSHNQEGFDRLMPPGAQSG